MAQTHRVGVASRFIRGTGSELWWPHYPDNDLFNSIGNLLGKPAASVLPVNPKPHRMLQISGHVEITWTETKLAPSRDGTGRAAWFIPDVIRTVTGGGDT